jgi:hypothetical protein
MGDLQMIGAALIGLVLVGWVSYWLFRGAP